MYRRALLTSLAPVLAGCSLAPSEPSTASYPTTRPNVFISFDWHPDRSALDVTFERGNRLTTENTGRLAIVTPDLDDRETAWVGPTQTNPRASFPLTPEATVTHEIPRPARTRVVWDGPGERKGVAVAVWRPETGSGETDG
ncbi:hypothetical protein [Halorubrum coriense]|uniref:hypothetical protein n=1 Tax=Halorubrum coriense TaxID=64713 RepID=UPI0012692C75|nr:hypothetical protein [Halorubrum coriense]